MTTEREVLLAVCVRMLRTVFEHGATKNGTRPSWWQNTDHEEKFFGHVSAWKHGLVKDDDSEAHPLVHAAARALMLAYQATQGRVDPTTR